MKNLACRLAFVGGLGLALGLAASGASAQTYPSKPIRIVVPYGAGTGLDILTRALTERLGQELNTSIVVANHAGSNGIIGTQSVAQSQADGYTLLATTQSHYTAGMMYDNLPYAPGRFVPVARFGAGQLVVVVSGQSSFSSIQSLVQADKKTPGKLSFASLGKGSSAHMAGALLNHLAGTNLLHVPYREASQAVTDTIRGEPSLNFLAVPTAMPQIKGGTLKAIAVTGKKRSVMLPDVPTLSESGIANYDLTAWYAILAPEGTPPAIVQRLSESIVKVAGTAEFQAVLGRIGLDSMLDDSKALVAKLPGELEHWRMVVSLTNAKSE